MFPPRFLLRDPGDYTVEGSLLVFVKGDPPALASFLGGASWPGPCRELLPRAEWALDIPKAHSEAGLEVGSVKGRHGWVAWGLVSCALQGCELRGPWKPV